MLFLNEGDIRKAVTMKEVIDAIDEAYKVYESGDFQMPTRMQVNDKGNTLLLMPCFTTGAIGTKLVTLFPGNAELPTIHGVVVLNNSENGQVTGILDGSFLTGLRTGAIGGSAVRHLAKAEASKLAIIGTGVQGLYQALAACTERDITDVRLFNRTPGKIPAFKKSLEEWIGPDIRLHTADSVEQAISDADIVITTTTSKQPVLPEDADLLRGKLIIGVGSFQPDMREFPEVLYKLTDRIFVDTDHAIEESGDLITPLEKGWISHDSIQTMAAYLADGAGPSLNKEDSIIFKSTGMALFDVVVANLVYEKAKEQGGGTQLSL
ncbi:ornithine cyclodeaminase family protein [Planococcus salinus]|uniref:Ornithine cyclodeaminase family protein n=1 Tax=Planococcus salinus TaxID=1848460 RepID=A0A3M8P5N8_9BACL|nr:ornithine cyclodeaminase family protein [Planococcus salinus]RNF39006.1 ornithine cyclodeaminase family protein [Planococcus salinus]